MLFFKYFSVPFQTSVGFRLLKQCFITLTLPFVFQLLFDELSVTIRLLFGGTSAATFRLHAGYVSATFWVRFGFCSSLTYLPLHFGSTLSPTVPPNVLFVLVTFFCYLSATLRFRLGVSTA